MLHVSNVKHNVINVIKKPSISLWHHWLGHMSKKGIEVLSHSCYLPSFSFLHFEFSEHCVYGKQTQEPHKRQK